MEHTKSRRLVALSVALLCLCMPFLFRSSSQAAVVDEQPLNFVMVDRQNYDTFFGFFGGYEVSAPETITTGSPLILRFMYEGNPTVSSAKCSVVFDWGSGLVPGKWNILCQSDLYFSENTTERIFRFSHPTLAGNHYQTPVDGKIDIFQIMEVVDPAQAWVKVLAKDDLGNVLCDRSYDLSGKAGVGADRYETAVDKAPAMVGLNAYLSSTIPNVTAEEITRARALYDTGDYDIAFTLEGNGSVGKQNDATFRVGPLQYDEQATISFHNSYPTGLLASGMTLPVQVGGGDGTLRVVSSISKFRPLTENIGQHPNMTAYVQWPVVSAYRTSPVVAAGVGAAADAGGTPVTIRDLMTDPAVSSGAVASGVLGSVAPTGTASPSATSDATATATATPSATATTPADTADPASPPVPDPTGIPDPDPGPVPVPGDRDDGFIDIALDKLADIPVPVAAAGGGAGALCAVVAAWVLLHHKDYLALKPLLAQIGNAALALDALPALASEEAARQAAVTGVETAGRKFLPLLYFKYRACTFIVEDKGEDGEHLLRKVRLRFRNGARLKLDLMEDMGRLTAAAAKKKPELLVRHPRKAMRNKRDVEIEYRYGGTGMLRDHFEDEDAFVPNRVIYS